MSSPERRLYGDISHVGCNSTTRHRDATFGQKLIQCAMPCCDDSPRKKHLNINLKKDVFRCPRCGISGGIFDLYTLYTGVSRDKARKAIIEQLGVPEDIKPRKKTVVKPEVKPECPLTDVDSRHATYSALLSKLSLAADHKENLLSRGLTEADIELTGL